MLNLTDSMRRIGTLAIGAAVLSILPSLAQAAEVTHVTWDNLAMVTGKTVSIAVPGGGVITGKAIGVESGALVVKITKTTDPKGWPKGERRVPRENLRVFRMRTKGKVFRVLATVLGSGAGLAGGAAAWWSMDSFWGKAPAKADAALVGIWAGGTVAGYFLGNQADKHWTTVEVLP